MQSTVENEPKLIRNMFKFNKNFMVYYNTFWLNFPAAIESMSRKIITFICDLTIAIIACSVLGFVKGLAISFLINVVKRWARDGFFAILSYIYYRKKIIHKTNFLKTVFNIIMFPWFYVIGDLCMYVALFKKVEWKPIPHNVVVNMNEINNNINQEYEKVEENNENRKAS